MTQMFTLQTIVEAAKLREKFEAAEIRTVEEVDGFIFEYERAITASVSEIFKKIGYFVTVKSNPVRYSLFLKDYAATDEMVKNIKFDCFDKLDFVTTIYKEDKPVLIFERIPKNEQHLNELLKEILNSESFKEPQREVAKALSS